MENPAASKSVNDQPPTLTPAAAPSPAPAPAPSPAAVAPSAPPAVPAGGLNGPMPEELKHWSWPAFLLNWIWGIAHNVWIALLMFVPVVNFFMWFYLGMKGNELAWQQRKFESVEQFKTVQKIWTKWAVGILIAQILLMMLLWSFIFSLILGGIIGSSASRDFDYHGVSPQDSSSETLDNSYFEN